MALNRNISDDFFLYRYKNGIKLIRPNRKKKCPSTHTDLTVHRVLLLPFCVYFSNVESRNIKVNEMTLHVAGFQSINDALKKTAFDVFTNETALNIISENNNVMHLNQMRIFESIDIRKDEININSFSIKFPWYDDNNKIIGIIGFTIALGMQSLAKSLSELINLGLLSSSNHLMPGSEINSNYFSRRELECLKLYTKGKTSKEIASYLGLSYRTVENYLQHIKDKLNVSTKTELIHKTIDYFRTE